MSSNHWGELNEQDLRTRLLSRNGMEVGLVPVGATEQHGPHLPTATDTIIAEAICDRVAAATDCLVLPAISIACSYGHGHQLAGTVSATPELLVLMVRQYAEWAAQSGLKKLLFVNAHYGNGAALSVATDHLRYHRPDLQSNYVDWYSADPEGLAEITSDGADIHANRGETSVMLAISPDLVDTGRMLSADDPDRTEDLVFRYTATSLSTNGVTGRPSEATPELGHRLIGLAVAAIADRVERGRKETPPLTNHRVVNGDR